MKLRFGVDQAAALRQGINAPTSIVEIEVDPGTLTEHQRNLIADRLFDGICVGSLKEDRYEVKARLATLYKGYINHEPYVITAQAPTLEALLAAVEKNHAAVEAALAPRREQKAKEEAERAIEEEKKRKQIEDARIALLDGKARLRAVYEDSVYVDAPGIGDNLCLPIGDDLKPAMAAYEERKKLFLAEQEARKAKAKAEAEAKAARELAMLAPFFTEAERKLQARNRLNLDDVRSRLWDDAIDQLLDKLSDMPRPEEYAGRLSIRKDHYDGYSELHTWSEEILAVVEAIEKATNHKVERVFKDCLIFNAKLCVPWSAEHLKIQVRMAQTPKTEDSDD